MWRRGHKKIVGIIPVEVTAYISPPPKKDFGLHGGFLPNFSRPVFTLGTLGDFLRISRVYQSRRFLEVNQEMVRLRFSVGLVLSTFNYPTWAVISAQKEVHNSVLGLERCRLTCLLI